MIKFLLLLIVLCGALCLQSAEIYIHYDAKWGNHVSIRGDAASLSWERGVKAEAVSANMWKFTTSEQNFSFKPLINDEVWSIGANYSVEDGEEIHIYPFFYKKMGTLENITGFSSSILNNNRTLRVYLPPSYHENTEKKYPVIYMHDGQNLFDASTAFGGVEWQVDETMNLLVVQGKIKEAIIIGMDNTGASRISEYTPSVDAKYGGGNGDKYLDFISTEVVPFINSKYRTMHGKNNCMLMGSSLGGLISFYAGWTRSEIFGSVGCLSSSFWWNNEDQTSQVKNSNHARLLNIYIDSGGDSDGRQQTLRMYEALKEQGYKDKKNLYYFVDKNGQHSEKYWAQRLYIPLVFLLGK
ncbi:alpha/beta hydrolase [Candidatus Uabimicrobium sp. HlEnr_7]|uniref:alpha/beta hydrolase n=1 Tax=Candidatus Uabimicrobium helgolandensis TaxID=3095367 RepID=UPI003555FA05